MGNYELLKAAINEVIKANGRQEITGEVLNQVLLSMVNSLGAGYQCMGVATPSTNPGTPDQNVFYFATQAGTYTNFDAIVLQAGISVLIWDGDWASQTWFKVDSTPTNNSQNLIASGAVFNALKLDGGAYDVTAHNSGATFASLSALLNSDNLNTLIPTEIRHGGMSIKFVQSSDNKYVQFRYMLQYQNTTAGNEAFANPNNWQGIDKELTAGSENIVEGKGLFKVLKYTLREVGKYAVVNQKVEYSDDSNKTCLHLGNLDRFLQQDKTIQFFGSTPSHITTVITTDIYGNVKRELTFDGSDSKLTHFIEIEAGESDIYFTSLYYGRWGQVLMPYEYYLNHRLYNEGLKNTSDVRIDIIKDFDADGRWNSSGTIDTQSEWKCGRFDVSEFIGKTAAIHFGNMYDDRMASYCYLDVAGVITSIADLPDFEVVTGSAGAYNVCKFTIPTGSTLLFYSYNTNSSYVPRYGYIESVAYTWKEEHDASIVALDTRETNSEKLLTKVDHNIAFQNIGLNGLVLTSANEGDVLFTKDVISVGENVFYNIAVASDSSSNIGCIELLDSLGNRLARYGKYESSSVYSYNGYFTIPDGFDRCIAHTNSTLTFNSLKRISLNDVTLTKELSDTMKLTGNYLVSGKIGYTNNKQILFDSAQVPSGTTLYYKFSNAVSGQGGGIEFLDANNTRIVFIGKNSSGGTYTTYEGSYEIPSNFSYCLVFGIINIDYLKNNKSNELLRYDVDRLDNALYKGIKGVYTVKSGYDYRIPVASICELGKSAYIIVTNNNPFVLNVGYKIHTNEPGSYEFIAKALNTILPNQTQIVQFNRMRNDVDNVFFDVSDTNAELKVTISDVNPNKFEYSSPLCIPNVGSGQMIVSRPHDFYAHGTYIINTRDIYYVLSATSGIKTAEQGTNNTEYTLIQIDKISGARSYKLITSDILEKAYYNGYQVTNSYVSCFIKVNNIIHIQHDGHYDNKLAMFYQNYNIETGELTSPVPLNLKYNGNTVEWNLQNYRIMLNTLYGYSFDTTVTDMRATDNPQVRYYNGRYYKLFMYMGAADGTANNEPCMFLVSDDLITWEVVARVNEGHHGECMFSIYDDKVYLANRQANQKVGYMVFDIEGNVLKSFTQINDTVITRPATFVYQERVFIAYNVHSANNLQAKRTKICIAEFNDDYSITPKLTHFDQIGYQYYDFDVYYQDIIMVNTCNVRTHNNDWNYGPTGAISLMRLPLE